MRSVQPLKRLKILTEQRKQPKIGLLTQCLTPLILHQFLHLFSKLYNLRIIVFCCSSSKTPNSKEKTPSRFKQSPPLPSTRTTASTPENKNHRRKKSSIVLDDEIFKVDTPSASSSIPVDNETDDLPSMLYSSEDKIPDVLPSMLHSSEDKIPATQEFCYGRDCQSSPIKKNSSDSMVECPICSKFFPTAEVEFHAALCVNETDPAPTIAAPEDDLMPCPICSRLFPLAQIEQHADECVETSISEGSNNVERESITI